MKEDRELYEILPGLTEELPIEFFHLADIFRCEAFDLCTREEAYRTHKLKPVFAEDAEEEFFVPYMMNDALEYYLVLTDASMTGTYLHEEAVIASELLVEEERYVLILTQTTDNRCTIFFHGIRESAQCYAYHRIGHYWVKGDEHLRRLVYMLGTMRDKGIFYGDRFLNEKEMLLQSLVTFGPLRRFSPVGHSIAGRYPESDAGAAAMAVFAEQAGEFWFARFIEFYRKVPNRFTSWLLSRAMLQPARQPLYRLLCLAVEEASSLYPERTYDEITEYEIAALREETDRKLREEGYEGTYPRYYKGGTSLLVTEEHPFTILEQEDYRFRVSFLVSETREAVTTLEDAERLRESGFFAGSGRRGYIRKEER